MSLNQLYREAVEADRKWSSAVERAGLYRYARESGEGRFAKLYRRKIETHEAWRVASAAMLNTKD